MAHAVNAAKCRKCGKVSYPTHFYCPACGETKFDSAPVEGEGTLVTFTRTYALPLDYEQLFITLGIVQMDQGIRATGRLDIDEPVMGMRVRATVAPVRDINGRDVYGLRFVSASPLPAGGEADPSVAAAGAPSC